MTPLQRVTHRILTRQLRLQAEHDARLPSWETLPRKFCATCLRSDWVVAVANDGDPYIGCRNCIVGKRP